MTPCSPGVVRIPPDLPLLFGRLHGGVWEGFKVTEGAETMLDSGDDENDAGRRTAAPNLAARPSKDAWRASSTLQGTGHVGVLQKMENFDNLPLNLSSKDAGFVF